MVDKSERNLMYYSVYLSAFTKKREEKTVVQSQS